MKNTGQSSNIPSRWTPERAWEWKTAKGWSVGSNFSPSNAGNQLEMWQTGTYSPELIDRELSWLAGLGFNSLRVFLHDLLWKQDSAAFLARFDEFLSIASKHGMSVMPVFFDSVWHPFPYSGPQRGPEPGVHNSLWLQSPGVRILKNPEAFDELEGYVTGFVSAFREDDRILAWDIWNEPDQPNSASYAPRDIPELEKAALVKPLLQKAANWIRLAEPTQPLTTALWSGTWEDDAKLTDLQKLQIEVSDVISFHRYETTAVAIKDVEALQRFGRPLICTEYMARLAGSTFQAILPYFKEQGVDGFHWGAVAGRIQTQYGWSSWQNPVPGEPEVWFHDVLRQDGTPYSEEEAVFLRALLS